MVPEPYYQLYTIHFIVNSHFFPAVSVLLMGKTTQIYQALWGYIKSKLPNFKPKKAKCDFEAAARNACESEIAGCQCEHCIFHYAQDIFKNSLKNGMASFYNIHQGPH